MALNKLEKTKLPYFYQGFYFLSKALLLFFLLELAFPGIVIGYFNLNILLIFWLLLALVIIFYKNKN